MATPCYKTLDELWLDAVNTVYDDGVVIPSRDGGTTELLGYTACLVDPTAHMMFNPVRKMSPAYAAAELLWYLSLTDDITMIKYYAPQYERFAEDGKAHGAYGKRWLYGLATEYIGQRGLSCQSQLHALITLLVQKPETRQAVVTMHNPQDLLHAIAGDKKDIPCTLSMQFFLRDGKLDLIVTMRSNDLWLGLPYDVFCFTCLQILIAEALGMKLGWYQHQADSLHLYDRNHDKALDATRVRFDVLDGWVYKKHTIPVFEAIPQALAQEKFNREHRKCLGDDVAEIGEDSLLGQCVARTCIKHEKPDRRLLKILSPAIAKLIGAK